MTDKEQKEMMEELMKQISEEQMKLHPEIYEKPTDEEVVNN